MCPIKGAKWADERSWIPIIGPQHTDADFLDFEPLHYHMDFRYLTLGALKEMRAHFKVGEHIEKLLGVVIGSKQIAEGPISMRCSIHREMPNYVSKQSDGSPLEHFCRLEAAFSNAVIDIDNPVCPHRGFPLDGLPTEDGIIVCPGHGLGWDVTTGRCVTRFRRAADNA